MERLRDLFPNKSGTTEAQFDTFLQEIQTLIGDFFQLAHDFFVMTMEDNDARLINHTISKMEVALKSCHLLLDKGFYGSANALYRQVYEYIVWLKMYVSMEEERNTLISTVFFADINDLRGGNNDAIRYLGDHFKISLPPEYTGIIARREWQRFTGEYYSELSALTHGSCFSQQTFIPSGDDYIHLSESLLRLVTIMCMAFYSSQLAYSVYGLWRPNIGAFNDYAQRAMGLHQKCEGLLSKLSPKHNEEIPWQIIILKGTWKYKE